MRSLHYPIALPDDVDMRTIARRVDEKAPLFAALPGLRFKAFLASSRARGAARNAYAPFYVWDDDAAAQAFLQGALFAGVIESFGRPAVLDRAVLSFALSRAPSVPRLATLEAVAAEDRDHPSDIARREIALQREAVGRPGLVAAASVLDAATWRVVRLCLWADAAAASDVAADAQRYEVLRAVGPGLPAASS
jgi:hypothetical protein